MWQYGYQLGFTHATTVQKRNVHDFFEDFISEIPMYQHGLRVTGIVSGAISPNETIENNLYNAYEALLKNKIILPKELKVLDAWLKELELLEVK
jgi:hypothetical protein